MNTWIYDVREDEFVTKVVERSREVPILVDFWAPWCSPCRILGPLLEKIVQEYQGEVLLARVNCDENPQLIMQFQVQGIPTVLALRDGQIVDAFVGVMPEEEVRAFVKRLLPSGADRWVAQARAREAQGDWEGALEAYEAALGEDSQHAQAHLGRLRMLVELERWDAARAAWEALPGPVRVEDEAQALKTRIDLAQSQESGPGLEALRQRVAQHPEDLEARFELAQALAAQGRYQEALETYLWIVEKNRAFREDGARKAMLEIFNLLGADHPLTRKFRERLAQVLFA